ncbi:MAG TPA: hypothetical protein VMT68_13755 [Caulobacteraceae bacterium]|nr:hypothetical protein [Caulobacteraceae bacterium]
MLDILLYEGFGDHASAAADYAAQLEDAATRDVDAGHLVQFAKVGTHTIGEHLADWPRAVRLAERLLAGRSPDAQTARAWAYLAVARLLAGDGSGAAAAETAACLGAGADFRPIAVETKFLLVAALVGCGRAADAAPIFGGALELARALGEAAPARAIAVAANNLASELLEAPERSSDEAALMRLAADAAHEFWLKCGDWRNDERARYLKALVANVLGQPDAALAHVDAALGLIAQHGEAPVDETFLRLAKAHALWMSGDAALSATELAAADAAASAWDDPGLASWYADERKRVLPDAAPVSRA